MTPFHVIFFARKNWCGSSLVKELVWSVGHIYIYFFFKDKSRNLYKIVSVLQSASVERFDVSRIRDFFKCYQQKPYFEVETKQRINKNHGTVSRGILSLLGMPYIELIRLVWFARRKKIYNINMNKLSPWDLCISRNFNCNIVNLAVCEEQYMNQQGPFTGNLFLLNSWLQPMLTF